VIAPQLVRRYAHNQQIDLDVADQEIVLHYALGLLNQVGLVGVLANGDRGPLLFKGGTALRKCLFGTRGRFSQDIDLDAPQVNGFEAEAEAAFVDHSPFHGIEFSFAKTRWSEDERENFSGTVAYKHEHGAGSFELQISYRLHPVLDSCDLTLVSQEYLERVEFPVPILHGLDLYEMIGEKIMACNRRQGGTAKDVYDLYLWEERAFDPVLVRRVAVLKAWTDQRSSPRFEPEQFLSVIEPRRFRWTDLNGLVPRSQHADQERICRRVRERFRFLRDLDERERELLDDQTAHRRHSLYEELASGAREQAARVAR
jgi:predicted nucleotidyltransferase component of viral defense system